jgi:multiple sugar transport system ATP-binding protein
MNFMTGRVEGDTVKLPFADVRLSGDRPQIDEGRPVIVGIRPESFEDATLVGETRDQGTTFRAKLDIVESMGSELYAYFQVGGDRLESEELKELAEDAGAGEVPGSGGEGQVVARLAPASRARRGEELELWVDSTKLHFFDAESGASLSAQP